jgi:hypothetical protein
MSAFVKLFVKGWLAGESLEDLQPLLLEMSEEEVGEAMKTLRYDTSHEVHRSVREGIRLYKKDQQTAGGGVVPGRPSR